MYYPFAIPLASKSFSAISFPIKPIVNNNVKSVPLKMIGFRGYKLCGNSIVTLGIAGTAQTNIYRESCVNYLNAKHRCDKAFVLDIWNLKFGRKEKSVQSDYDPYFKYTLGTFVHEPEFSNDLEEVCDKGIHFFLREELAETYADGDIISQEGNDVIMWNDDGELKYTYNNTHIASFVNTNDIKFCRANKF